MHCAARAVRLLGQVREVARGPLRAVTVVQMRTVSKLQDGPGLEHFLANAPVSSQVGTGKRRTAIRVTPHEDHPYISKESLSGDGRKVYFDVHGCQMNVNDTDVVWSILHSYGYELTQNRREADIWMVVTCSIRESAEDKIWSKLRHIKTEKKSNVFRSTMKVGLLGCMAERLKDKLLGEDRLVDVVAGPDSYRDLPRLLAITAHTNQSSINVLLSADETYADVIPMRLNEDKVSGFVSIQRGCDNMCSFCIVPFTRGRERSRPVSSILKEAKILIDNGVKDITLLGQNVNSYRDVSEESLSVYGGLSPEDTTHNTPGFKTIYKAKTGGVRFADLLHQVSELDPEVRIRFTSPHPKDFPSEVLDVIAERNNICKQIHLPAQSGSSKILEAMRRGYTREAYLELVQQVREKMPQVTLSSDMIAGFCGETDEDFEQTLSLMEQVRYAKLFMFPYSLREKTHAHRQLKDDVPQDVKTARFERMRTLQMAHGHEEHQKLVGSQQVVLVEGDSKRSANRLRGRTDGNALIAFDKVESESLSPGDYCVVKVTEANWNGFRGEFMKSTSLKDSKLHIGDSMDADHCSALSNA